MVESKFGGGAPGEFTLATPAQSDFHELCVRLARRKIIVPGLLGPDSVGPWIRKVAGPRLGYVYPDDAPDIGALPAFLSHVRNFDKAGKPTPPAPPAGGAMARRPDPDERPDDGPAAPPAGSSDNWERYVEDAKRRSDEITRRLASAYEDPESPDRGRL